MKVYDSFLFFNELDLLELRLTMLDPYVDYFVLSECDHTFSGNKKPFYFEKNKHLFTKFLDKIIHIKNHNSGDYENLVNTHTENKKQVYDRITQYFSKVKNSPETDYGQPHWCRDYLHREFVSLGLSDCNDDDIIMLSDLDEIPNPTSIKDIKNLPLEISNHCLYLDCHNYFINNLSSTNWMGTVITTYGKLKQDSICNLRRNRGSGVMIENGGWHLSFVGGSDRIKYKISSYGHQEFNNNIVLLDIENKINTNTDIFSRSGKNNDKEKFYYDKLKKIDLDGYYPNEIVELVKNKFPYLIKT